VTPTGARSQVNRRGFVMALVGSVALADVAVCALGEVGQAAAQSAAATKAFDTTADVDSPLWFADAYAEGFRLYIPNTTVWGRNEPWPRAAPQLKLALDAGLMVAAYARNPSWWSAAIQACSPYVDKLQFFCLDVETDPGVPVTQAMVDGVTNHGVRPLIYSGSGMWPQVMGSDDSTFAALPLWDRQLAEQVSVDFTPDVTSPPPQQYGGWNTAANPRVGVQQGVRTDLNGVIVDVSSFSSAFLMLR
jgi:hypothetical protein